MTTQLAVNAIAIGCIYALVALGFILLYNSTGIINFAQGELVALGAYLVLASLSFTTSLLMALALALCAMTLLSAALFLVAYYPLRQSSALIGVVGTVGIGIALRNGIHLTAGPLPHPLPSLFGSGELRLGNLSIPAQHLSVIVATVTLFAAYFLFTNYTRSGIRIRAVAQDRDMAAMVGIPATRTMLLTFVVSALISTVAGFLAAPIVFISPEMGLPLMLKGFIAIVIGGFGSVHGAIVGGMLVGILETFVSAQISSAYRDVFAFAALILVLVVRPKGLFGERVGARA